MQLSKDINMRPCNAHAPKDTQGWREKGVVAVRGLHNCKGSRPLCVAFRAATKWNCNENENLTTTPKTKMWGKKWNDILEIYKGGFGVGISRNAGRWHQKQHRGSCIPTILHSPPIEHHSFYPSCRGIKVISRMPLQLQNSLKNKEKKKKTMKGSGRPTNAAEEKFSFCA